MLIDTHAHLDHVKDIDAALREAAAAGVEGILAVSMDLASCRRNLELKRTVQAPRIFLGMGIHPGEVRAEETGPCLEFIQQNIADVDVIGEIGLDFWYKWVRKDQAKHQEQREVFRRQLELAKEFGRPVVVHSRGTWRECFETVRSLGIPRAVFHWYSGPLDVLEDIVKAGYFVSAGPALAYSPQSRAAIAQAPLENTLIETDCPVFYRLGPDTEEGFTSSPKDVVRALKAYVELKNIPLGAAEERLTLNAKEFLGVG